MKATIVNTLANTTNVVELNDNVHTLADLKDAINIQEGQFFEGSTHTDLTSDSQSLPELPESKRERGYVFFVSPAQNKMKNGAYDRKECYSIIKAHNLQNAVKEAFSGRNFTQVATDALNSFISENIDNDPIIPTETSAPVADPDAGKIVTEKQLLTVIANSLPVDGSVKASILEGISKVFPNPYSVQDLTNMRG